MINLNYTLFIIIFKKPIILESYEVPTHAANALF